MHNLHNGAFGGYQVMFAHIFLGVHSGDEEKLCSDN